jgi:hypothetical protein
LPVTKDDRIVRKKQGQSISDFGLRIADLILFPSILSSTLTLASPSDAIAGINNSGQEGGGLFSIKVLSETKVDFFS